MNKKTIPLLLLAAATGLTISLAGLHGMVYLHEQAHKQAALNAGCEPVNIYYDYFNTETKMAWTEAENCPVHAENPLNKKTIHFLQPFATTMWLLFSFLTFFKTFKKSLNYSKSNIR